MSDWLKDVKDERDKWKTQTEAENRRARVEIEAIRPRITQLYLDARRFLESEGHPDYLYRVDVSWWNETTLYVRLEKDSKFGDVYWQRLQELRIFLSSLGVMIEVNGSLEWTDETISLSNYSDKWLQAHLREAIRQEVLH